MTAENFELWLQRKSARRKRCGMFWKAEHAIKLDAKQVALFIVLACAAVVAGYVITQHFKKRK